MFYLNEDTEEFEELNREVEIDGVLYEANDRGIVHLEDGRIYCTVINSFI